MVVHAYHHCMWEIEQTFSEHFRTHMFYHVFLHPPLVDDLVDDSIMYLLKSGLPAGEIARGYRDGCISYGSRDD